MLDHPRRAWSASCLTVAALVVTAGLATTAGAAAAPASTEPGSTVPAPDGTAWPDADGHPIMAHGGSVVTVSEAEVGLDITGDGTQDQDVHLWYGEDKTNATRPVDGVRGYWSTDLATWHDLGRVLPTHQHFTLTVEDGEVQVDPAKVEALKDVANKTAPDDGSTQEQIDEAKAFVAPYVETWADEANGVAASYDEDNLANASYRLNGNINIVERPKMLWNAKTSKFVIIYHADGPLATSTELRRWVDGGGDPADRDLGSRYGRAEIGFATSDTPWGPFRLVNTTKMNWAEGVPPAGREGDSRDMTVFQDEGEHAVDPVADDAYAVYSSEMNKWMYVSRLNAEYTGPLAEGTDATLGEDFSNRVLPDFSREASAVFKTGGWYYMITSGTDGWASTPVVAYRSRSMITPTEAVVGNHDGHPATGQWERLGNPCVGAADRDDVGTADPAMCFDSQPTFVITLDQEAGHFVYMGDRWKIDPSTGSAGQGSRYVWAPVQVDSQTGDLTIENVGPWDPRNETLFRPLEPVAPLELEASTEDRDDFDPTFDVVVDGVRYDDLTARWSPASLDAAFSAPGTYPLEGHVAGDGPLAGRHVTATVDVTGPANLCTEPGTTVSASFHQTDYGTFPAQAACDGDHATTWSTWASGSGKQDRVSFTISLADRHRVGSVRFTSTEGTIASVGVEHQDADGSWRPVSSPSGTVAAPGAQTRISFEPVVTSGVRLTFDTPGSWLKIPEIVLPGPTGDGPQATTEAEVRCLGGRALLAVRAVNTSDGPVDVTLGSAYGTRDVADVAPGASAYQTFATRQASVEAGSVTVTVTDPTGRTAVVPTTHAGADCS